MFPQLVPKKTKEKTWRIHGGYHVTQGECFAKMMELGLDPTAETFRILVRGAAKEARDLDAATRLGAR